MIEYVLGQTDVARVRFAQPVLYEVVASLRAVRDQRHPLFGGWLSGAAPRLRDLRMDLLTALVPLGPYVPDFLLADVPGGDIDLELDAVARAEPDIVRLEIDLLRRGRPVPRVLLPLYEDPAAHLPALATELHRYWEAAIEPLWSRIRAVGLADIAYRLDRFASGGVAHLLSGLNPDVAFDGDTLTVRRAGTARGLLDGRGVVLVPSVFVWPGVLCSGPTARQTVICYAPARGRRGRHGAGRGPLGHADRGGRAHPGPAAGRAGPAGDDDPTGRTAAGHAVGGQPAPEDPQGVGAGRQPAHRPGGALSAHARGDRPAGGPTPTRVRLVPAAAAYGKLRSRDRGGPTPILALSRSTSDISLR